jgi:hypothetical protein
MLSKFQQHLTMTPRCCAATTKNHRDEFEPFKWGNIFALLRDGPDS